MGPPATAGGGGRGGSSGLAKGGVQWWLCLGCGVRLPRGAACSGGCMCIARCLYKRRRRGSV